MNRENTGTVVNRWWNTLLTLNPGLPRASSQFSLLPVITQRSAGRGHVYIVFRLRDCRTLIDLRRRESRVYGAVNDTGEIITSVDGFCWKERRR